MKEFLIQVPEGQTKCLCCPFNNTNKPVCEYLLENKLCTQYDFSHLHIWNIKIE